MYPREVLQMKTVFESQVETVEDQSDNYLAPELLEIEQIEKDAEKVISSFKSFLLIPFHLLCFIVHSELVINDCFQHKQRQ